MDFCSRLLKKPYCLSHYFDINTLLLSWLVSKFWQEWILKSKPDLSPNIRFLLKVTRDFLHRKKFEKTQSYSWDVMIRKFGSLNVPLIREMTTLDFDIRSTMVRVRIRWIEHRRNKTPLSFVIRRRKEAQSRATTLSKLEHDSITEFWIEEYVRNPSPMSSILRPIKFYENGKWYIHSELSSWKFLPCSIKKISKFMASIHITQSMLLKRVKLNSSGWQRVLMHNYWVIMKLDIPFDIWRCIRDFLMIEGHSRFFYQKVKNERLKEIVIDL
jgi:hypothetical protein